MFSYNYWIEPPSNNIHPEGEEIFGSFRDYWDQISLGKLKIEGQVVNPDYNQDGVPEWLKASGTREYYFDVVSGWDLAVEAYQLALDSSFISEDSADTNYYDKYVIIYALEAPATGHWVAGGDLDGTIFFLAERSGPNLLGGTLEDKSFTHIGVYLHEFGHTIGLKDEYIGQGEEPGATDLYNFCLMAYGMYNGPDRKAACPATLSAYYRLLEDYNWINSINLDEDQNDFIVEYNYANPKLYRIDPLYINNGEHYIIETKIREGFDMYIPGDPSDSVNQAGRLIIWQHNTNSNSPWNGYYDRIRIKPADNVIGDSTQISDFFPGSFSFNNYQDYNDTTAPSATINDTHPYFNQPGDPAKFALNGIQKLTNGNSLIEKLRLIHGSSTFSNTSGWQLISVPLVIADYSLATVFPGCEAAYKFDGSYIQVDTLENGPGYWAKFDSSRTVTMFGDYLKYLEISVDSGWNIVGSINFDNPVVNVCTEPPGIIDLIYGYNGGYIFMGIDSTLKPSEGYWVKTTNSGTLLLDKDAEPCELSKITSQHQIAFTEMDKFIITDSEGYSQSLYVSNIDIDTALVSIDIKLPPMFPEMEFDSRFEYDDYVKRVSADSGFIDLNILVQTNSYPISLSWEINPGNGFNYSLISDSSMGKLTNITNPIDKKTFKNLIENKIQLFAKVEKISAQVPLPVDFELEQNYPNPFNPSTIIKFAIPKESQVNLTVFNILGERVKELKNEVLKPGYYEINFDASMLASGIYLYRIQAGEFVQTKKMILMK